MSHIKWCRFCNSETAAMIDQLRAFFQQIRRIHWFDGFLKCLGLNLFQAFQERQYWCVCIIKAIEEREKGEETRQEHEGRAGQTPYHLPSPEQKGMDFIRLVGLPSKRTWHGKGRLTTRNSTLLYIYRSYICVPEFTKIIHRYYQIDMNDQLHNHYYRLYYSFNPYHR